MQIQLNELQRFLRESGGPFFAGKDVTLADLYLLSGVGSLKAYLDVDLRSTHAFIKQHNEDLLSKEKEVATYWATRKV